jgi:predicted DNA-binding transcriptional regulator AlpA
MSNQSHLTVHSADPTPSTDSALQAATGRLIRQNGPDGLFGRLAVSKATGHRLLASGKIGPRPIRLGSSSVRYDLTEVLAWLAHRRPDGQLHDAKSWPAVWEGLRRQKGGGR